MPLTAEQTQRLYALERFQRALAEVRQEYLRQLENVLNAEETEAVWFASFVLQYMTESHEKYVSLLQQLSRDDIAQEILVRWCETLTADVENNLQAFIVQVENYFTEEASLNLLKELSHSYILEGRARMSGFVVLLSIAIILAFTLNPIIGLWTLTFVPIFSMSGMYLRRTGMVVYSKESDLSKSILALEATGEDVYSFEDEYSYQPRQVMGVIPPRVELQHTNAATLRNELRNAFFQKPKEDEGKALYQEVQTKFNILQLP